MTDEDYKTLCCRLMASGYDIEELRKEIKKITKRKMTSNGLIKVLTRQKEMSEEMKSALSKIFNIQFKDEIRDIKPIKEPAGKEADIYKSIIVGNRNEVKRRLDIQGHSKVLIDQIDEKIETAIRASYQLGIMAGRG